jgi:hypothetical protein
VKRVYVSPKLTAGRDSIAVAHLFRQLASIGYYVVSKEINSGDKACTEFVLVYVPKSDEGLRSQFPSLITVHTVVTMNTMNTLTAPQRYAL